MTTKVDRYFDKTRPWHDAAVAMREALEPCGLEVEIKWGKPCYSFHGKNIVILQEMKSFLSLMYFNGSAIDDPEGRLESQGENSHVVRRLTFRSAGEVTENAAVIRDYVQRAIAAHLAGVPVEKAPEMEVPQELVDRFDEDPDFRAAFDALTPGRQRGYLLHFNQAKQSATRAARIDRVTARIFEGKGFTDR